MGPNNIDGNFDIIWVDVDDMYYIVPRPENYKEMNIDERKDYFNDLCGISTGAASTMAGHNAVGIPEMEDKIKEYIILTNKRYYDYINSLKEIRDEAIREGL